MIILWDVIKQNPKLSGKAIKSFKIIAPKAIDDPAVVSVKIKTTEGEEININFRLIW